LAVAAIAVGTGCAAGLVTDFIMTSGMIHVLLSNDYRGIATHFGVADYSIR
jgi:hypothetical protein